MHTYPQPEMNRKSMKNMEKGSGVLVLNACLCAGEAWLEPPPLDWSSDPLRCSGFDSAPPSADCCLVHLAGNEIFFRLVPGTFYTLQHIPSLTQQNCHAFSLPFQIYLSQLNYFIKYKAEREMNEGLDQKES